MRMVVEQHMAIGIGGDGDGEATASGLPGYL